MRWLRFEAQGFGSQQRGWSLLLVEDTGHWPDWDSSQKCGEQSKGQVKAGRKDAGIPNCSPQAP